MKKTTTIISLMILILAVGANAIQITIDCNGKTSSPGIDTTTECTDTSPQAVISLYISDVQAGDNLDQLVAQLDYDNALLLYSSTGLNTGIGRSEFMISGGGTAVGNGIAVDSNTVDVGAGIQGDCATAGTCPSGEGDVLKITFDCMDYGTVYCSGGSPSFTLVDTRDTSTTKTWWAKPDGVRNLFEEPPACTDNDDDGYGSPGDASCTYPETDCDDSNANINPGATELCNGLDDDCNAATPDGADEAWLGDLCDGTDSDLCNEGTYTCTLGSQSCNDATGNTLDLCNGLDDDCNAATPDGSDEPTLNDPCDGADSDLCKEGNILCSAGSLTCSDNDAEHDLDLCNGNTNDDCNAATPDGSDEAWLGDVCDGADSDLCEEGTLSCSGGSQSCNDNTGDNLDVCDGADNDCNAGTDDGSDESWYLQATSCGTGACEASGLFQCTGGVKTDSCIAGQPAADDATCDGVDDDCDGTNDEDYVSLATDCGVGACYATGSTSCVAGTVEDSCIEGTPAAEVCEGQIDENCDGTVDEDCGCTDGETQQCGTTDVGPCEYGTQTCSDGVWGTCIGNIEPEADDITCNGIDEDCDGTDDEDYAETSTDCGVGSCEADGVLQCVAGAEVDSCTPGQPAADDATCDGIDDDCDGTDDEDYVSLATECGVGACYATGSTSCVAGSVEDSCTPGQPAADDATCDGIDDDCDGTDDEDYVSLATECGIGACYATGTLSCVSGTVEDSCTPGSPAADDYTCDGVDEDCDGTDDEDYIETSTSCGIGACEASGLLQCVSGNEEDSCTAGTPSEEVCEGQIDDDCDGSIDEGCACTIGDTQPCGSDVGECQKGTQTCNDGTWGEECVGEIIPTGEICDNKDNDCDGTIDESITQSCGTGLCAGTQTCSAGSFGNCSTEGSDGGVCALCDADGNPIYDETQDTDCDACPADRCGIADNDGIIDDYYDYPVSECKDIDTCTGCETEPANNDQRCLTVMKIPLDKGISMFSLPLAPETDKTFDNIQNGCTFDPKTEGEGIAYWDPLNPLDSEGQRYEYLYANEVLYPGQGYFTYQLDDCNFIIEGYKFTEDLLGRLGTGKIHTGWNMIGAPSETVNDFDLIENTCTVTSGPWGFDTTEYVRTQKLEPGKGYFIKSTNNCNLG